MGRAELNEDFVDVLQALVDEEVEFVIVGAHALAAHGIVRATGDIDIFVRPTTANAARVLRALAVFGAPVAAHGVTAADFEVPDNVYQMGLPPRRIDILTSISGVTFDEAWRSRLAVQLGPVLVSILGRDELIRNKTVAARPKDLLDVAALQDGPASPGRRT